MVRFKFLIFFLFTLFAISVQAENVTWKGTTSTSWYVAANWDLRVPLATDHVIIDGTSTANPVLDSDRTIAGITFSTKTLDLAGFTLTVAGPGTFSSGSVNNGFLSINSTSSLTFSGTAFGAPVTGNVANLYLNGSVFNAPVNFTINQAVVTYSDGGNIFHSTFSLIQSGAASYYMGNVNKDIFNGDVTLKITSANHIVLGYNSLRNEFNGNVYINNVSTYNTTTLGGGIYFSIGSGSSELASTKLIQIGSDGYQVGVVRFQNFTQLGAEDFSLYLPGTYGRIVTASGATFNGPVFFKAPEIYLLGTVFMNSATIEKTGAVDNHSTGGNTFHGQTSITNSGTAALYLGVTLPDNFIGDLSLVNTSSTGIYLAHKSAGNRFGNIKVSCTKGTGVFFGNHSGSSEIADGKSLSIGSFGFSRGTLQLNRVKQFGTTPIDLNMTLYSTIQFGVESVFEAPVKVSAPNIFFVGTTMRNTFTGTKTGTNHNTSSLVNYFHGDFSLTVNSSATVQFGNSLNHHFYFYGDASFIEADAYANIQLGKPGLIVFYKDLNFTVNSGVGSTIGHGGTCRFTGSYPQVIKSNLNELPFHKVEINKTAGDVTLETNIVFEYEQGGPSLAFTSGKILTGPYYVRFANDQILSGVSPTNHIVGRVRKTGDDAFTFPIAKNNIYRPVAMSAPGSTSDIFEAEYFPVQHAAYSSVSGSILKDISNCEYWSFKRISGASSVALTLDWDPATCSMINANVMAVGGYNTGTALWEFRGNAVTGDHQTGKVTSDPLTVYGDFTLGYRSKVVLDTREVNYTDYFIEGADRMLGTIASSASGTNNGLFLIHPDLPAVGLTDPFLITINSGLKNDVLELQLFINDNSDITRAEAKFEEEFKELDQEYYSVNNGNTIAFHLQAPAVPETDFTTNLVGGVLFDLGTQPNFTINTGNFTNLNFRIKNVNGETIYQGTSPVWNGTNGANLAEEGNYFFELDILSDAQTTLGTFKGQLIFKSAQ